MSSTQQDSIKGGEPLTALSPAWLRLRLAMFEKMRQENRYTESDGYNDDLLLRSGVLPAHDPFYYDVEGWIEKLKDQYPLYNDPLSFTEITRYNTWFELHPEKVLGTEQVSGSLIFPITIKGKREDIEAGFSNVFKSNNKARQLRLKALALEIELQLLQKDTP